MIEQDPRLTEGPTFFPSLYGLLKRIIAACNANEKNTAQNTTNITGKVNRSGDTMTGALNLVSPSTSATEASSDNSTRIATTAWAKAGFAVSLGSTGYIKFPSWMGGLILQWGVSALGSLGSSVSFPMVFPNAVTGVLCTANNTGSVTTNYQSLNTSSVYLQTYSVSPNALIASTVMWLALGW